MFLKKQLDKINNLSKIQFIKNYSSNSKRFAPIENPFLYLSPEARLALIPQYIPQPTHSVDALKRMSLSELEAVVTLEGEQYIAMFTKKHALEQLAKDESVDDKIRSDAYKELFSHIEAFDTFAKVYTTTLLVLHEKLQELVKIKKASSFESNYNFYRPNPLGKSSIEDLTPLSELRPKNNLE